MKSELRKVLKALERHPRVTVSQGRTHIKVFVDNRLVTVLSPSHTGGHDLKASLRALRHAGVTL